GRVEPRVRRTAGGHHDRGRRDHRQRDDGRGEEVPAGPAFDGDTGPRAVWPMVSVRVRAHVPLPRVTRAPISPGPSIRRTTRRDAADDGVAGWATRRPTPRCRNRTAPAPARSRNGRTSRGR